VEFASILTHKELVVVSRPVLTVDQLRAFLTSARFINAFPDTSSAFASLPCPNKDELVRLGNIAHDILLLAFENSKQVDDDVIDLLHRTVVVNRPNGCANAYASIGGQWPIVVILAGLTDLAMFFNSIFYLVANYAIDDDSHRNIWELYLKFIVGKERHSYFLPWIWEDMMDGEMYKYAAFNSTHAVCFAFLHEYAHIRLGHKKLESHQSIEQEFAADAAAINLIDNKDLALFMALEFFKLFELLDYLKLESSHPYCHKRLLHLYEAHKAEMNSRIREMYEFHIKRATRIFSGMDSGRHLPPINKFWGRLPVIFGNWKPFPRLDNVTDYLAAKGRLYTLINRAKQNGELASAP